MIEVKKFVFNPFLENTYVIWSDENNEAMVIDPGCFSEEEENELTSFIAQRKLNVKYLITTHCHIDHIFGCAHIKEKYNPVFIIPEHDLQLLKNVKIQAEMFGVEIKIPPLPDLYLNEDISLSLNQSHINFIFTPGHTPGEFCIYLPKEKILFSGDVLFRESIGRTDLWGGSYEDLIKSIKDKLLVLPIDVRVFPGHGEETTIGEEKLKNPFLINN
ncbi:MAG: MBL fold metallo-hydrolase [Ignavibacteriaceae bacterium]|nr:MBL fold metallo-hydrolase [Ignavibacteriaceae bacterium]